MNKNNIGFLQGLIAGLVVLVFSMILYAINHTWFLQLWLVKILIINAFMVYCAYLYKKANKDVLPFEAGLKNTYVVWIIAFLMWFAFKFVLFQYIDPDLVKLKHTMDVQAAQSLVPEDKKVDAAKNVTIWTPKTFAMEVGVNLIIGFFYALIIGGAFSITNKKPEPGDLNTNDESESTA